MFYPGRAVGGRLSVLDVIELPTTYGVEEGVFNVVLAGGVRNLVDVLEEKEDDMEEGWKELQKLNISSKDIVVGISASGTTPFVLSAFEAMPRAKDHHRMHCQQPTVAHCSGFRFSGGSDHRS